MVITNALPCTTPSEVKILKEILSVDIDNTLSMLQCRSCLPSRWIRLRKLFNARNVTDTCLYRYYYGIAVSMG